ncbi:hypothetical protein CHARACLAT_029122 [Characodon lateralis]|uniref:Uncharacterized protein n=1 Tax=Characodon lateralis TaxID=208331 RepID=A0ABU7D256_9TELE|nr:hypothetical protein [Characodon lateralis]
MENTEKKEDQAMSPASSAMENILRGLNSLSGSMDQLALRTHLKQCDLIVHINHPDKMVFLQNIPEAVKQQLQPPIDA